MVRHRDCHRTNEAIDKTTRTTTDHSHSNKRSTVARTDLFKTLDRDFSFARNWRERGYNMVRITPRGFGLSSLLLIALSSIGCVGPMCCYNSCGTSSCNTCGGGDGCDTCSTGCARPRCGWGVPCCSLGCGGLWGRMFPRSLAIPDQLPVGAVQGKC